MGSTIITGHCVQGWPSRAESRSRDSRLGDSAEASDSRLGDSGRFRAPIRPLCARRMLFRRHCVNQCDRSSIFIIPSIHLEFVSIANRCHRRVNVDNLFRNSKKRATHCYGLFFNGLTQMTLPIVFSAFLKAARLSSSLLLTATHGCIPALSWPMMRQDICSGSGRAAATEGFLAKRA
jgi:hypothetical protein